MLHRQRRHLVSGSRVDGTVDKLETVRKLGYEDGRGIARSGCRVILVDDGLERDSARSIQDSPDCRDRPNVFQSLLLLKTGTELRSTSVNERQARE